MICLPTTEDLDNLQKDKNYGGPVEPLHKDSLTPELKKLLPKKMGKGKKLSSAKLINKASKDTSSSSSREPTNNAASCVQETGSELEVKHRHKQEGISSAQRTDTSKKILFADVSNIVTHCSRDVIGFVTSGSFSFIAGSSRAIGFVHLASLVDCFKRNVAQPLVLIRNPNSCQYRFAKLCIVR